MNIKYKYYYEILTKVNWLKIMPKIFNYLVYKISRKESVININKYTPQISSLIITKRCNMSCSFCSAGTIMDDAKSNWKIHELTLNRVKEIFKNPLFKKTILVDLLGGEPLLVRELDDIVAFLSKNGFLTNTSTNGILLKKRIGNLMRAGITRINVSYYHENKELLYKDLPEINKFFPLHMSYVLMNKELQNNVAILYELVKFAKESGCKSLRFFLYRPMGLNPDNDEIIYEDNSFYHEFKSNIEKKYPNFVLWPNLAKVNIKEKKCVQLWQRIGCTTTGEMQICCGVEDFLKGVNSNLLYDKPEKIINHKTLVDMRSKLLSKKGEPPEICKNCNLLNESGW